MGKLYTNFGNGDVAIEMLAFGKKQDFVEDVSHANAFQMKRIIKKFAKHLKKNYVPLAVQYGDKPTGNQFYVKIKNNNEWLPVIYFHWKDENKNCGVDSAFNRYYVKNYKYNSWVIFKKRWQSLKRFANMIGE